MSLEGGTVIIYCKINIEDSRTKTGEASSLLYFYFKPLGLGKN